MYKLKSSTSLTIKLLNDKERQEDLSRASKDDTAFHYLPEYRDPGGVRPLIAKNEMSQQPTMQLKMNDLLDVEDAMAKTQSFLFSLAQIKSENESLGSLVSHLETLGESLEKLKGDMSN